MSGWHWANLRTVKNEFEVFRMKSNNLAVKKSAEHAKADIIQISDTAISSKQKATEFFESVFERNIIVQVMVFGAQGRNELWKGKADGVTLKGDFDNKEDLVNLIGSFRKQRIKYEGMYFSLHKPNDGYISKAIKRNCLSVPNLLGEGGFLKKDDIKWLSYIYVDIDPKDKKRPVSPEINAKCIAVRDEIAKDLVSMGFPEGIRLNSGNGASILIRVSGFRNNQDTLENVKIILAWVGRKFDDGDISIDQQVRNPGRSCRVPYTKNGKKSGESKINNRYAKIDYFPKNIKSLEYKNYKKFIEGLGIDTELENNIEDVQKRKINVPKYLNHYGIKILQEKVHDGDKLYCLDKCIFDPKHSPNKASIRQDPNGKLYYSCLTNSCFGKTFHDARKIISGDDKLTDFIEGAGLPAHGSRNQYEGVRVVGMAEVMACKRSSQPLITDILDEDECCIIVGPSGAGKSALTLGISLAGAALQKPTWGLSAFEVRKSFATLFVQSENSIVHTKNRINLILKHNPELEKGKDGIFILGRGNDCMLTGELSDPKFQALLIDFLIECNVKVLVIDPLISFHNKNENDNAEMRKELDCLKVVCRIAGVSVILVHHAAKGHTAENKGGRGASAIGDWADRIIFVNRESKDGKELLLLTCQKSRNSAMFKPFYIDITDFKFERASSVGDEKTDVVMKALDALGGEAKTQEELAKKVMELAPGRISDSTAKRAIKKAVDACLIDVIGTGKSKIYRSLEQAEEVDE
jgi:hypothetical protein